MPRASGESARSDRGAQARRRWSGIERELRRTMGPLVAGMDEVGRGPLAGPVVACAVIMPPEERAIRGVDDSKRLTAAERVRLAVRIRERAVAVALGAASVREIDRYNIYHATVRAMRRALARLPVAPDHLLVDGRAIRTLGVPHTAIIGGDAACYSIACASIVAKITRDRLMRALAVRHPGYRWEHNVGYSTRAHFAGIAAQGITPHHRRSFLPVRQMALDLSSVAALPVDAPVDPPLDPAADAALLAAVLEDVLDAASVASAGDERADGGDELPGPEDQPDAWGGHAADSRDEPPHLNH
ncbi:MAG TPA: ribonuclease HII [Gemmatimonadaceae bacterium]|nr:ribonuclease HII [Gemmatimonadaceae bacterium]